MIWRLEYCNKYGDTARLDIQRGASTPIEVIEGADNPFSLKYKLDASNKTGYFMSSSAEISIFETATFNIDELKTSNETELKVNYYVNSDLKWTGFILPDFFSRVIGEPAIVEMTATDRLGTLKGVTLTGLTAKVTLRSLLEQSLLKTGISLPVQYDAQISESGTNVFDTEILSQRIVDTRGRNISCYDIIKSILVATNSTIRQRDGKWQIYNKLEHESVAPSITFNEVEKGARRTIQPVASSVGIFQELGGGQIYPDNYNFINGLSDWALGGSSPSFVPENRNVMGYTTGGMPIYGDSGFFSIRGYNSADPVLVTPETNPHIKSNPITIQTNDAASVKVNVDVNATGQNIATNIFTVIVFAEKVGEKLAIDQSGVFTKYSSDINKVGQFYHNVVIYDKGKKNIDAVTVNKQISGVLTADNVNDYKITVLITGTWLSAKTVFINSVATTFSSTVDTTKGNIFKTNQGVNFTREHEIDTTIFGDYIARGINGYFYKYMPDDTSSLMLTDGSFTDLWTAFGSSEQLPLLQHMTRQKSKMFSIAHDILSATIEAQSFDPLAIYQSCDGEKWVIIEANYDFLRSNVDVVLEQIKYGALEKRDYIYSYFGDGESGIKSIGGISSGTGGGGSGGGMTADQVAILSEVQVLAHDHGNKEVLDQVTQDVVDNALREMIISTDTETELTDENYLSSLRVLKEILDNNEYLRTQFISKVNPDTAQEIIKFVKGIEIGTFTTGPLGAGAAIKMENGVSRMEVDQLDVRMRATFRELIIESLKHIGGQLILSPARMKCNKVVDGGTYYKCYFDTGDGKVSNEFVAGDQARCQVFTGSGVKMYWRLVTSVGTDWINLSKTDAINGSSIPEAGDDIVQLGNRSDVTRQNAQILSTVGADAPSWKQYKGINSFSLEGKDTTVFSGTGNKIDGKTVFTSNGANVEDGINSKNSNYSSQPTSYKANDTWTLSADTTVNGIAYKSGEILTATQDSTTYNQAHWVKKVRYTDDTAVNNLEIGGRNLIVLNPQKWERGTIVSSGTGSGDGGSTTRIRQIEYYPCLPDTDYVISRHTSVGKALVVFYDNNKDRIINMGFYTSYRVIPSPSNASYFRVVFAYEDDSTILLSALSEFKFKLEKGNKPTDWTPAPEDVQAEIDSAKQDALTAAGNAQTSANNANTAVGDLNTYVDGSFKDGVIEASEAKAIEKYINIVNTEKSNLEATYNTLYANTYLEGTPKSDLLNAKVTYFGAVDTLLGSINTAIADGKTTTAEKQAVDTNYSSYKTALASLQTAIENANKTIQAKLDTLSTDKINNLQIGGKNLLVGSKDYSLSNPIFEGSTCTGGGVESDGFWVLTMGTPYLQINIPSKIAVGERFTFSLIHTRRTNSAQDFQVTYGTNIKQFNSNSDVQKLVFTAVKTSDSYLRISRVLGGSGFTLRVDEFQLEKGDKATGYSEATEDIQARIDAAKLTAEQAQLAADGYMRAMYIRDWAGRNTANNYSLWYEVKVFNKAGANIAQGKSVEGNRPAGSSPYSNITDGNTTTYGQPSGVVPEGETDWVEIDLGQIYYDIDYIQVWHYPSGGRTYYGTKTEISVDGVNWTPVFDSAKSGTYKETAAGNIITFRPNEVMAKVLKSAATTDKFSGFDGGLATAVIMEMREPSTTTRGDATAGISGIQKDASNNFLPSVWAGGTYADALSGAAKAIIWHDGKVKFVDGEFAGGTIAGWNISSGRIGKIQTSTGLPTDTGLSLHDSFIKFSDSESSVFLGTNVLPASTGMVGMGRIINTNANVKKIGMYFDMAGADTSFWDGSSNNIAIYINRGVIAGAKFNGVNKNLTSAGYTIGKETVVCIYTTANYTVRLPANPEVWEFKWIFGMNNQNYTLSGNGKNIWSPLVGSVASLTFGSGMLVYTGQEWAIFS